MTYHWILNMGTMPTMGATSGEGTAYSSGVLEFASSFHGIRVTQSIVSFA